MRAIKEALEQKEEMFVCLTLLLIVSVKVSLSITKKR